MQEEDQTALEIVKLGYAVDDPTDARRVLTFRARFNTLEGACEALRAIDRYNAFDGGKLAARIADPALGIERERVNIEVGREGSPVVYFGPFWGGNEGRDAILAALADVHADEIDVVNGNMIRAWWD